ALTNILSFRFKGFDPDRLLARMSRYTNWFFSWPAFVAVLILGISALSLILTQFDTFQAKLPGFQDFFAAKNWIWLAMILAFTKVFHEFGHGLACKRFGGQCHEMGVMLLVLTPCLYMNVSDSWMLPNKWKRACIAAAGMYVELVLSSIAVFVWWYSQPGLINQLALNLIFISSVSTLLFNANPLLRYDGYYILADLMEIPNLRQKATTILQRTAGNWFLGIESAADPFLPGKKKWLFATYAICAALYRWFIMFSIFWFLYGLLEPYGLKIIGQAIALSALYGLFVMPLQKCYKFFTVPGRIRMIKKGRALISGALAAALIAFIMTLPVPHYVYCSFYVQPENAANVYVDIPGTMTGIYVEPNQQVVEGQEIITLRSAMLEESIATLHGNVNVANARLESNKKAVVFDKVSATRTPVLETELESAQDQLDRRLLDIPKLTVRAPISGTILEPQYIAPVQSDSGALGQWHGSPLDPRNLGAAMDQQTLVARVVPDLSRHTVVLAIDQTDIELINPGQEVELLIQQIPGRIFQSQTVNISPVKMKTVPNALSSRYGGDLVTIIDDDGNDIPQSSTYEVSVPLADEEQIILPGSTGVAKIRTGSTTIGWRIWRLGMRTFRFDL
ncbi:MAG: site-2 protease family protein, partial [Planctomycetota bacterium]